MDKVAVTPKEVREARAFLQKRNIRSGDILPRDFARVAAKLSKPFSEVLRLVAALSLGAQGKSQFEETKDALSR